MNSSVLNSHMVTREEMVPPPRESGFKGKKEQVSKSNRKIAVGDFERSPLARGGVHLR